MTTSRPARRRGPGRGAKIVTGTVTAVTFVAIVAGMQTASAAQEAAQARLRLADELAARDVRLIAQWQATTAAQARIAEEAAARKAAKKAAAKRKADAEKAAATRRTQQAAATTVYRGPVAAPQAAAPRTAAPQAAPKAVPKAAPKAAPKPAPKAAAPRPAPPVDATSGGSGG